MLHNEARNMLVKAYEKTHDAKAVALAYGVSVPTVYRPAEQKATTGSVDLRVSERGRKRVLTPEDSERIAKAIDGQAGYYTVRNRREIGTASWNRNGAAGDPGNGVPAQKEDDPRFRTGASPMCRPRENNGVGLRRQSRHLIWFSWMKVV
jgi:hypothetical protein